MSSFVILSNFAVITAVHTVLSGQLCFLGIPPPHRAEICCSMFSLQLWLQDGCCVARLCTAFQARRAGGTVENLVFWLGGEFCGLSKERLSLVEFYS